MLRAALAVVLFAAVAGAQTPDRVTLKSGRVLVGHVVEDSPSRVTLKERELGEIEVPRTAVRCVAVGGRCTDLFPIDPPTDPGEVPESHLRWTAPRGGEDGGLETCTSRWRDVKTGTTVFLVGVVHIADPSYYGELQKMLDSCDLVLFEGVGKGEVSNDELASLDVMMRMQLAMRGALGLGFQKDFVDYDREFWVNSDVDYSELRRALADRSASLPTDHPVVQRLLKSALSLAKGSSASRSRKLQHRMKNLMGPGLAQADAILQRPAFSGMRGAVIEYRNEAVMKDLDRELARGIEGRWIAIFYGAGHLPDFAHRFTERGMQFEGAAWSRAWTIPAKEPVDHFAKSVFDDLVEDRRTKDGDGAVLGVHVEAARSGDSYGNHDDERFEECDTLGLLVELFATHAGHLDEPISGWQGFDDSNLHRTPGRFGGWPVRRLGEAMLDADTTVRAEARKLVIALLGGAIDARAKLRHRVGIVGGDVDDRAAAGRLLAEIARGEIHGLDAATTAAVSATLFVTTTAEGRLHAVTLRSDATTSIDLGYLQRADGESIAWTLGARDADVDLPALRASLLERATAALR